MNDEDDPIRYAVRYKPTGKVFGHPDPHEKPPGKGIHGRYHTREEAEKGLAACLKYFNTRQTKRKGHHYGDGLVHNQDFGTSLPKAEADEWLPPVEVVIAWIDEERDGKIITSGEPKCLEKPENEPKKQGKKELATA